MPELNSLNDHFKEVSNSLDHETDDSDILNDIDLSYEEYLLNSS